MQDTLAQLSAPYTADSIAICCRRINMLLFLTACLLVKSVASIERAITCDYSLNVHHLNCDHGVINVESALYGRENHLICNEDRPIEQLATNNCSLKGTTEYIKLKCDGRKVCELSTNDVRRYNPCHGIFKYLETNYTCNPAMTKIVCQESLAYLSCETGQVIHVYGAHYGRSDYTTCAYGRPSLNCENVHCSMPVVKVAQICNGKPSCAVRVSNRLFGNPCHGTYKYLEVGYVCEYPVTDP